MTCEKFSVMAGSLVFFLGGGGEGEFHRKAIGGSSRTFLKEPLRGARISFCEHD